MVKSINVNEAVRVITDEAEWEQFMAYLKDSNGDEVLMDDLLEDEEEMPTIPETPVKRGKRYRRIAHFKAERRRDDVKGITNRNTPKHNKWYVKCRKNGKSYRKNVAKINGVYNISDKRRSDSVMSKYDEDVVD